MRFRIMGQYNSRPQEELDTAETESGAKYLMGEYRLAFGAGWRIWIEEVQ